MVARDLTRDVDFERRAFVPLLALPEISGIGSLELEWRTKKFERRLWAVDENGRCRYPLDHNSRDSSLLGVAKHRLTNANTEPHYEASSAWSPLSRNIIFFGIDSSRPRIHGFNVIKPLLHSFIIIVVVVIIVITIIITT